MVFGLCSGRCFLPRKNKIKYTVIAKQRCWWMWFSCCVMITYFSQRLPVRSSFCFTTAFDFGFDSLHVCLFSFSMSSRLNPQGCQKVFAPFLIFSLILKCFQTSHKFKCQTNIISHYKMHFINDIWFIKQSKIKCNIMAPSTSLYQMLLHLPKSSSFISLVHRNIYPKVIEIIKMFLGKCQPLWSF